MSCIQCVRYVSLRGVLRESFCVFVEVGLLIGFQPNGLREYETEKRNDRAFLLLLSYERDQTLDCERGKPSLKYSVTT